MGCISDAQCPPTDARFWAKVEKRSNGCWQWIGYARFGYGRVSRGGRLFQAHRMSFEEAKGRIPAGMVLDHLCRNTLCVNPEHLDPVSQATNIARGDWFVARNALTTHCPQGHPYSGDNLYVIPSTGGRMCRICRSAARQAEKARRRERDALGLGPGRPGRRATQPSAP